MLGTLNPKDDHYPAMVTGTVNSSVISILRQINNLRTKDRRHGKTATFLGLMIDKRKGTENEINAVYE